MDTVILVIALAVGAVLLVGVLVHFLVFRQVRGSFFNSNGTRIHYTDQGRGTPVILVHGFAANKDLNWRLTGCIRSLLKDFRVIALDVRAHGLSEAPYGEDAYGLEMVHDIARLMDHLGIRKAHVAGYSMGGFIALSFCAHYPDRIISCVAGGTGWLPREEYPDMIRELPSALREGRGMTPILRYFNDSDLPVARLHRAFVNFIVNRCFDTEALAVCFTSLPRLDVEEELMRTNTVPTLGIVGTDDPLRAAAENLVDRTANYELRRLEGRNHINALFDKRFRVWTREFFNQHTARSGCQSGS